MKKIFLFCLIICCFVLMFYSQTFSEVLAQGQNLPSGLVELSYDGNNKSVFGSYELDGEQVFIEVRRGPATPAIMRKCNKDWPLYEIDVRLFDKNGRLFFVQVGGHSPIDQSWMESFNDDFGLTQEEKVSNAQRLFILAQKMVSLLMDVKFTKFLTPEHNAIKGIMPLIESALVFEDVSSKESSVGVASGCTDMHVIEIWKQPAFFGTVNAEHSGTETLCYSGGILYAIWIANNHGTAPGEGSMRKACSNAFSGRCRLSSMPLCSTSYGFTSGKHVCNDDTYIQYYRIKYNTNPSTTGGTCSDSGLRVWAPTCW